MKEPIRIEIQNVDEFYKFKEKDFINHFYGRKSLIPLLVQFIIGLFFFVSGVLNDYDTETMILKDGQEEVTLRNYHFFIGIGAGLILYTIHRFWDHQKSKKASQKLFNNLLKKIEAEGTNLSYSIRKESISSTSPTVNWSSKWNKFDNFKIDKNHLRLYSNTYDDNYPEFIIPIHSLSQFEREEINKHLLEVVGTVN